MARNRTQNLKTPTPVLAVIGVGDLAVEKIREVSSDVQARSSRVSLEPKQLQTDLETLAKQRADDVRTAQHRAQQRAEAVLSEVVAQATTTYDTLADRGEKLVNRIRRQPSTQQAKQSAATARSQAKATTTTARKGAASTRSTAKRNASSTASSAKKSASRTQTRAKGAATSTRKAADAAGTATAQGAQKVGD